MDKYELHCRFCEGDLLRNTKVGIIDSHVYQCDNCGGYSLLPRVEINYDDSSWTKRNEKGWPEFVARGKQFAPRILRAVREQYGVRPNSVLEIGCGNGWMGAGFLNEGVSFVGIDVDEKAIHWARDHEIEAYSHPIETAARDLRGRRFDLILSSNVFEHVESPITSFENVFELLSQRGVAIIIVPNGNGMMPRIKAFRTMNYAVNIFNRTNRIIGYSIDGYWHDKAYAKKTLDYLCGRANLEIIHLSDVSINDPVFGFVQPCKRFSYRMIDEIAKVLGIRSQLILSVRRSSTEPCET